MTLLGNWNTIMGKLSDKVRLEKIKDQTLLLGVYEASWMQELYLLSPVLIKTINNYLGKPYVKELRFKSAAKTVRTEKKQVVVYKETIPAPAISPQQEQALAQVNDPQLRSVLEEYLKKCYEERQ